MFLLIVKRNRLYWCSLILYYDFEKIVSFIWWNSYRYFRVFDVRYYIHIMPNVNKDDDLYYCRRWAVANTGNYYLRKFRRYIVWIFCFYYYYFWEFCSSRTLSSPDPFKIRATEMVVPRRCGVVGVRYTTAARFAVYTRQLQLVPSNRVRCVDESNWTVSHTVNILYNVTFTRMYCRSFAIKWSRNSRLCAKKSSCMCARACGYLFGCPIDRFHPFSFHFTTLMCLVPARGPTTYTYVV